MMHKPKRLYPRTYDPVTRCWVDLETGEMKRVERGEREETRVRVLWASPPDWVMVGKEFLKKEKA